MTNLPAITTSNSDFSASARLDDLLITISENTDTSAVSEQQPQTFGNLLTEILKKNPVEYAAEVPISLQKQTSTADIDDTINIIPDTKPEATDTTNDTDQSIDTTVIPGLSDHPLWLIQRTAESIPTVITIPNTDNPADTAEPNEEPITVTDKPAAIPAGPPSDNYSAAATQPIHSEPHTPLPTGPDTTTGITPFDRPGKSTQNTYVRQSTSVVTNAKNINSTVTAEPFITATMSENTADTESANPQFSNEAQHSQLSEPANPAASGKTLPPFTSSIATMTHTAIPATSHTETVAGHTSTITTPFHQPAWSEAFNQKITWLVNQGTQAAELKLHPAHLGPIEISLQLSADQQLTAQFTSQHPAVRDAIEANLPRLREIMAESGITLADTSVGADNPQQQTGNEQSSTRHARPSIDYFTDNDTASSNAATPIVQRSGLIDTFA